MLFRNLQLIKHNFLITDHLKEKMYRRCAKDIFYVLCVIAKYKVEKCIYNFIFSDVYLNIYFKHLNQIS